MGLKEQYDRNLVKLLNDKDICKQNRDLFKKFFEEQEYKLKRKRGIKELNDKVLKTLNGYINRLRNVNRFFKNKAWKDLTKEDIKEVYDKLEDEKFKNERGTPFKDKSSYYNKIMKSRPFAMVEKDILAKEIIVSTKQTEEEQDKEVRFITEGDFKKILSVIIQVRHKTAIQLGWDIGENMTSLLQLKASDCKKEYDSQTKEPFYNIRLRAEILKTGRTKRTEPTIYPETTQLLDLVLQGKEGEETIFEFDKPALVKVWKRAIEKTKVRCEPDKQIPTIKDIRSGMACHLLEKDWTTDEIKSRLGHKPSSSVIDKYVNYKAKGKQRTRTKIRTYEVESLKQEIEEMKSREKLNTLRTEKKLEEMSLDFKRLNQSFMKLIKKK
jgi:integrase